MGMDLHGEGGTERLNNTSWYQLLRLASEYGWQPAGTQENEDFFRMRLEASDMPEDEIERTVALSKLEWDGDYFFNNYQIVTDDDARGLAEALTRALEELPSDNLLEVYEEKMAVTTNTGKEIVVATLPSIIADEAKPAHYWSGSAARIRGLITFFEAGSFMIG